VDSGSLEKRLPINEGFNVWKFRATIRTKFGDVQVVVEAPNQQSARTLIESMYGKGNILGNLVNQI